MDIQNLHIFDISLSSLNLFSFMLGMLWAFFNQGMFGRRIAMPIFLYFIGLAAWYGIQYTLLVEKNKTTEKTEQVQEYKEPKKEVVGQNGVRWTVSDTLPPEWGVSQEHINKLLDKVQPLAQKD